MVHTAKLSRKFTQVDEGAFFKVLLSEDHLCLMISYSDNTRIGLEEAQEVIDCARLHLDGVRFGLTAANGPKTYITSEARKLYSKNDSVAKTIAHAVITDGIVQKLIADIFAQFDSPIVPVKTFKSLDGAMNWLENEFHRQSDA